MKWSLTITPHTPQTPHNTSNASLQPTVLCEILVYIRNRTEGRRGSADQSVHEHVTEVEELILSHKQKRPDSKSSFNTLDIVRIIHRDLGLRCSKRRRAQELTNISQGSVVNSLRCDRIVNCHLLMNVTVKDF